MAISHRHGVAKAAYAFTSALALLLKRLGKHNVMEEPDIQGIEPDITYGQQDSLTMIETKFYRRSSPPHLLFLNAL